ncbi:MAG: lysophospholipid acyltransferase family protein [Alphaproteobacteria bacterium]
MKKDVDIIAVMRGIVKVTAFLGMIFFLIPVVLLYKRLFPERPFDLPQHFHRLLLRLFGIRLCVTGTISTASPVLFVSNHTSYLDIPVLGSLLPAAFVAKSEVASWPLFGFMSRVQNTIFIERRSTRAAAQRTQMQEHLAKRQNLILFPEGTSSEGFTALPFKSSLFGIIEESAHHMTITVQPISVTCTKLDGFPLLREQRPLYAWYGDMTMPRHLWNVFKRGHFTVDVIFHPPLTITEGMNRKLLAATCQNIVARGIEQSLMGRAAAQEPLLSAKE